MRSRLNCFPPRPRNNFLIDGVENDDYEANYLDCIDLSTLEAGQLAASSSIRMAQWCRALK